MDNLHLTRYVHKYVDENDSAAMLPAKELAGVAPEINPRNPLHEGNEAHRQGNPPLLWNPEETSTEVQNLGISVPTKRTDVLQENLSKKTTYVWL